MRFVTMLVLVCLGSGSIGHAASQGASLPDEVLINQVEFIRIPAGHAWHPIPDTRKQRSGDRPMREVKVSIDAYYIAKYEARARDFVRFMNRGDAMPRYADHYEKPDPLITGSGASDGCGVRKNSDGGYFLVSPTEDLPVTHLSWDLANEFANWMGFRLPSEAEWVRAFRGDTRNVFPWGNDYPDDTYAGFQEGASLCNVRPVTAFSKGRSPFGVYNMAGNVYEYVADWFSNDHYNQLKDGARNPVSLVPKPLEDETKHYRILRGGRWASGPQELSIYGNRDLRGTNEPFSCYGLRFALDEAEVKRLLAAGSAQAR